MKCHVEHWAVYLQ